MFRYQEKNIFRSLCDSKMWSGIAGEFIVQQLLGGAEKCWRPKSYKGMKPDLETLYGLIEVKTRNWTTPGTAGEKIFAVPHKYRNIVLDKQKPLYIILVAYQEYEAVYKFKLFEPNYPYKEVWRTHNIHYIRLTVLYRYLTFHPEADMVLKKLVLLEQIKDHK